MKNKLKLTTIFILLMMLIIPINAETINIDYQTDIDTGEIEGSHSGSNVNSGGPGDSPLRMLFPIIQDWKQIKAVIYEFDYITNPGGPLCIVRDIDIHTSDIPVTYTSGAGVVGAGNMQFVRHLDGAGALTGGIMTFTFDTGITTELIGNQIIYINSLDSNYRQHTYYSGFTKTKYTDNCPQIYGRGLTPLDAGTDAFGIGCIRGIGYKYSIFHHNFNYDYNDITKNDIYLDFNREDYTSSVTIIGSTDIVLVDETSADDMYFDTLFDLPYNISILNPAYTGVGPYEYYNYTIPTGYEVEPTNIAKLTYRVYDAEEPSKQISTSYNLTILNETSDLYEQYKIGFNPGIMDIDVINNRYYNMTIEKYQYLTKSTLTGIIGDTDISVFMYRDYAGNYTVTFKLREHTTGIILEGVKVIGNGVTKYTGYDGSVGFGDIDGILNYEVSKTGYVPTSGNATITYNQAIFVYMSTEEDALPTTPPTTALPGGTPDIEQPTNLLESIQYAFAKMFGFTISDDLETMDLFMGLGIIFAGAVLIGSITKDALGAVVGALIGFVMSLALGFIPLWVLFVGFASFAIYIILTKTGGE